MKTIIPKIVLSAALVAAPLVILNEASANRCYTGTSYGGSYRSYSRGGSSFSLSIGSGGYHSYGYGFGRHSFPGRSYYSSHYYRPSYRSSYHYSSPRRYVSHSRPYVGAYYSALPRGYNRCYVGGVSYFSSGGHYYRPYNSGYVVVSDPYVSNRTRSTTVVRQTVNSKYDSYPRIWVSGEEYLIDEGELFKITSNGLVWAEIPLGSVASSLPTHASSVWYKEVEYFEAGGLYFQRVPEGYRIILPPWEEDY